jgi:hypothetical protein
MFAFQGGDNLIFYLLEMILAFFGLLLELQKRVNFQ